jgi:sugar lactone lactonase YvrE
VTVVADCPSTQPVNTLLTGQGVLESVVTGPDRKLYYTDTGLKALVRLDSPTAAPQIVADGIDSAGGLLPGLDGTSVVLGYGDALLGGVLGNLLPSAGLLRVDLVTGQKTLIAKGTAMSNGLARDAAGTIYASSDVGTGIDRVVGSQVQRNWAAVASANGLAIDEANRYLYANQTFQPAAVQRIDLQNPSEVTPYATAAFEDFAAGLDGLTIDADDNLYAAANQAGEVWRIDAVDQSICALARGLKQPSAVAFGDGGPFPSSSLYVVGFGGEVTEIPAARAPASVRVRVKPRRLRARVRTTVTVRVGSEGLPVPGVVVTAKRRLRGTTGARGIVRFTLKPRRRGRVVVFAAGKRITLRVRRAGPVPRPLVPNG